MRQASKWKKERKKIHFNINYLVKISSQTITQKKKKQGEYWQIKIGS